MLATSPPPLAEQVATLAADLRLAADRQAQERGAIAALQALILVALARLIAALEGMVTLWQAGLLPPPAPPRALATPCPRTHPIAHEAHLRARRHRARRSTPIAPALATPTAPAPSRPAPMAAPPPAPLPAPSPHRPSHAAMARAPPWPMRSKHPLPLPSPHANFVPLT